MLAAGIPAVGEKLPDAGIPAVGEKPLAAAVFPVAPVTGSPLNVLVCTTVDPGVLDCTLARVPGPLVLAITGLPFAAALP